MDRTADEYEGTVQAYFKCLAAIQAGEEKAVDEIMQLWDPDGQCEFVGPEPLCGEFRGYLAVAALYSNIARTAGKCIATEKESTLAKRTFEVGRTRVIGDKLIAEWNSEVATEDGRGYNLSGSNTFSFKRDKIKSLRIVTSPKPEQIGTLSLDDLTVNDIGRLALAAWAVV